jgi:hypothetical protein
MTKLVAWVAIVFALVTLRAVGADDDKQTDEGKGSAFKSKVYDVKDKGEKSIVLSFEAGKEVTVTTKGPKEADVDLFVKGKYFEARDTSPGPDCLVKFTPVKGDDKFTFTIKNTGSGATKVTLEVKVAE